MTTLGWLCRGGHNGGVLWKLSFLVGGGGTLEKWGQEVQGRGGDSEGEKMSKSTIFYNQRGGRQQKVGANH